MTAPYHSNQQNPWLQADLRLQHYKRNNFVIRTPLGEAPAPIRPQLLINAVGPCQMRTTAKSALGTPSRLKTVQEEEEPLLGPTSDQPHATTTENGLDFNSASQSQFNKPPRLADRTSTSCGTLETVEEEQLPHAQHDAATPGLPVRVLEQSESDGVHVERPDNGCDTKKLGRASLRKNGLRPFAFMCPVKGCQNRYGIQSRCIRCFVVFSDIDTEADSRFTRKDACLRHMTAKHGEASRMLLRKAGNASHDFDTPWYS